MLEEYLALVHHDLNARRAADLHLEHLTGMRSVFTNSRITVLLPEERAQPLKIGGVGVVIGTLFRRHGPPASVLDFSPDEVHAIQESNGASLIDRFWGAYIAILESPSGVTVVRDPSAAIHCYQLEASGATAFASDAAVLCKAKLLEPQIDWPNLARHLYTGGIPSANTAIHGLQELLPGRSVTMNANQRINEACWSPWDFVHSEQQGHIAIADRLREVVQQSVRAWASCHRRIMVGISGGLDSSIVASCLSERVQDLICMTVATTDADGDERAFAEVLCRHIGTQLVTAFYSLDEIDFHRSAAPHLPLPVSRSQSLSYNAITARLISDHAIDAFYTGNGGDNVFAFSYSATAIYDRYLSAGVGTELLKTTSNICKLTGCSPWQAMASALRIARAPRHNYCWRPDPLFLDADLVREEAKIPIGHAWLDAPDDAHPGKASHIAGLLRFHRNLQTSERDMGTPVINPLVAQPVVEECLAIPSWHWCEGGVNRAVARSAFANTLPTVLLQRKTKGRPDSFCNEIIDSRRAEIRERLLDGQLARNNLLDRNALERTLSDEAPNLGFEQVRILAFMETEAWLEHWTGARTID
ncbi:asparagine synthase [Sphingomonas histidinilytica]|uniref:asparagine synthase-related protein n=1 Tax=Rhizorhabdus histidinilytica TaxID=439228 RepID=UPI001ADC1CD7|nr:asparagine synthetase B family protein [Rhizorhabdus histidinilytica]MBO9375572.1 asparagine synthase [Rhizorhabdus histidinilytica]